MTFAVIVQARYGSSRLPGKTLQPLGAKSALLRCLDRCARIPGVDAVVAAVPDTAPDEAVAAEARRGGFAVVRGPEHDVLRRYALAARAVKADVVMRVTSDCPFIDPSIAGAVRDLFVETQADYAGNGLPPGFPHGLDAEVFSADLLFEADVQAQDPYEREHVTPWLKTRPQARRANLNGPGGGLETLRWTLDYPEDLAFFRAVFAEMGEHAASAGAAEIASLCLRRPDIVAINAMHAGPRPAPSAAIQSAPVPLELAA